MYFFMSFTIISSLNVYINLGRFLKPPSFLFLSRKFFQLTVYKFYFRCSIFYKTEVSSKLGRSLPNWLYLFYIVTDVCCNIINMKWQLHSLVSQIRPLTEVTALLGLQMWSIYRPIWIISWLFYWTSSFTYYVCSKRVPMQRSFPRMYV